jgi:hypothetical protein
MECRGAQRVIQCQSPGRIEVPRQAKEKVAVFGRDWKRQVARQRDVEDIHTAHESPIGNHQRRDIGLFAKRRQYKAVQRDCLLSGRERDPAVMNDLPFGVRQVAAELEIFFESNHSETVDDSHELFQVSLSDGRPAS